MYSTLFKGLATTTLIALTTITLSVAPISHTAQEQDDSRERVVKMISINNSPVAVTDVRIGESSITSKKQITLTRPVGQWAEFRSKANEDWLSNVGFTLRNVSERPIVAITAELLINHPGIDLPVSLPLTPSSPVPAFLNKQVEANPKFKKLMPGEEIDYQLGSAALGVWEGALKRFKTNGAASVVELNILRVQFDRDTSWSSGEIFRRNPANPSEWIPERKTGNGKRRAALTNAAHARGSVSRAANTTQTGGCRNSSNDTLFDCWSNTEPCEGIDQNVGTDFGGYRLLDSYDRAQFSFVFLSQPVDVRQLSDARRTRMSKKISQNNHALLTCQVGRAHIKKIFSDKLWSSSTEKLRASLSSTQQLIDKVYLLILCCARRQFAGRGSQRI